MGLLAEILGGVPWCISGWGAQPHGVFFLSHLLYFLEELQQGPVFWETKENLSPWPVDVVSAVSGCLFNLKQLEVNSYTPSFTPGS